MVSVKQEIDKHLQENPFIQDLMAEGLLNLSSYGRKIKPQIEEKMDKEVSIGSIVMALKRLSAKLQKSEPIRVGDFIEDIMVRSGLVATTYENLDSLAGKLKQVVDSYASRKELFVNFSRGNFETTLVCNQSILPELKKILSGEKLIVQFTGLGSITIKLTEQTSQMNGVYYSILKMIANRNINIVEIISTYKELTILVDESELDKAFVALNNRLKSR